MERKQPEMNALKEFTWYGLQVPGTNGWSANLIHRFAGSWHGMVWRMGAISILGGDKWTGFGKIAEIVSLHE
jgi:hypothetical protein